MRGVKSARTVVVWWLITTFLFSVRFLTLPDLDSRITGWFAPPYGFAFSDPAILEAVKTAMLAATGGIAYLALIVLVAMLFYKPAQKMNARFLEFLLTFAGLGPGVIVNGLLKRFSGRVRPRDTDVFGAEEAFSPFLDFIGTCGSNCSSVSAEASALAAIAAIVIITFVPFARPTIRSFFLHSHT